MLILVIYPGCLDTAGLYSLQAGLGPLVPPTTWGSWLDEGAVAEVGNNGCARRSFLEAAAAVNGKGENTPPHHSSS